MPEPDPTVPVYSPAQIAEADCYNNLIEWLDQVISIMNAPIMNPKDRDRYNCFARLIKDVNTNYVSSPSNACQVYNYVLANFDCVEKGSIQTPTTPGTTPDNWQDGGANSNTTEPTYNEALRKPIWWCHTDHLGSSSYITDNFGRPSHYYDQLPFGEIEDSSNSKKL